MNMRRTGSVSRPPGRKLPRWRLGIFQAFAAGGLFLNVVFTWGFFDTLRSYRWKETPCTIVESHRQPNSDAFAVSYRYVANGLERTSSRFTKGISESPDRTATERLLLEYPPGHPAVCYVNPANPEEAILHRGSLWLGASILLSLGFVAAGVCGMIYGRSATDSWAAAIVQRAARPAWLLLSPALVLAGLVPLWVFSIHPVLRMLAARSWQSVPCQIVSSEVVERTEHGEDSTYGVKIIYKYEVNGHPQVSDRYDFFHGSSSVRDAREEFVERHPARAGATCYANPTDRRALLQRREIT